MKHTLSVMGLIVILTLLAACGPSPEKIATMTASAWTPTPVPPTQTPTPTPVPIDLTISIVDETGAPIAGGNILFPESGSDAAVQTDEQGKYSWSDLASEAATVKVSAQGYIAAEQIATLQRGPNEVSVVLKRDPFGLLPAEACASGEKLLYAEDFQDGKAQGWQTVTAATDFAVQNNWAIAPLEDGDLALTFSTKTAAENGDQLQDFSFDNAVWRLKVRESGTAGTQGFSFLNWKQAPAPGGETRYPLQIGVDVMTDLTRLQMPDVGHFSVGRAKHQLKQDAWYFFEISTYNGLVQVWADGKELITYQDPKPLPAGTIGLEVHIFKDAEVTFAYDDFSVCGLNAPFTSIVPPAQ